DRAPLPAALHRGPARHAQAGRGLDAARRRRRAEGSEGGHRRGVGSIGEQSRRRLVWPQEGPAGPLRELRAACPRGPRTRRGGAQPPQQSNASPVMSTRYHVERRIDAPPEKVWALLADASTYPNWN